MKRRGYLMPDSPPPSIPCAAVLTAWDKEQTIRSSGKRGTPRGPSNSGAGRARWGPTPDREIWGASGWRTTRYPSSCLRDRQLSSLKHLAGRKEVRVVRKTKEMWKMSLVWTLSCLRCLPEQHCSFSAMQAMWLFRLVYHLSRLK